MPFSRRFHRHPAEESDGMPVFCPECGRQCEIRHLKSGLDYDWCLACNREVTLDTLLIACQWGNKAEEAMDDWISIYREAD